MTKRKIKTTFKSVTRWLEKTKHEAFKWQLKDTVTLQNIKNLTTLQKFHAERITCQALLKYYQARLKATETQIKTYEGILGF